MSKDLDHKCKQCRREGVKLFLKGEKCYGPKCPIVRRNYPPGIHGAKKTRQRLTEYGHQLREKQKAKKIYGILERPFRNYYQKAIKQKGDTNEILGQLLEMRLDNVIYRLGLAKSRKAARQLVSHGFFLVNGKKVNIPSYQVKIKDEITIKPSLVLKAPLVLKAQTLSGKRAQGGGIVRVDDPGKLKEEVKKMFSSTVNGEKVEKILVEEEINKEDDEYYLSFSYSTESRGPVMSFGEGGTGVESHFAEASRDK